MRIKRCLAIACLLGAGMLGASAQKVALKTNLISDAVTSPNLGLEFRMAPKWTFDISGQMNAWNINDRRWRHWMVMPEARVWFCEAFQGSFFALHALGGQYNVGNLKPLINEFLGSNFSELRNNRFQGWGVGAGVGYGYDWILARHWNLEFEFGVGFIYTKFNKYPCDVCGDKKEPGHHIYYGPTKLSLAIEYVF